MHLNIGVRLSSVDLCSALSSINCLNEYFSLHGLITVLRTLAISKLAIATASCSPAIFKNPARRSFLCKGLDAVPSALCRIPREFFGLGLVVRALLFQSLARLHCAPHLMASSYVTCLHALTSAQVNAANSLDLHDFE